jgi:hypothetical protein
MAKGTGILPEVISYAVGGKTSNENMEVFLSSHLLRTD